MAVTTYSFTQAVQWRIVRIGFARFALVRVASSVAAASVRAEERGRGRRGGGYGVGAHKKSVGFACIFARWCGFPQNVRKRLLRANGGARAAPRPLDEWLLGHWVGAPAAQPCSQTATF